MNEDGFRRLAGRKGALRSWANAVDRTSRTAAARDALLPGVDAWLAELFDDDHLDETCEALAAAAAPDPALTARHDELRRRIAELDTELESYRTVMRNQPDAAATVGKWIAQTSVERRRLESILRAQPTNQLTSEDIRALVASLRDIAEALQAADPSQKAEVYAELGISVTYHPDRRFLVEARPRVVDVGVGGPIRTDPYLALAPTVIG